MLKNKIVYNSLILISSFIIALIIIEVTLKINAPYAAFNIAKEFSHFRNSQYDLKKIFTIDSEFGFRPILGNGYYTEAGVRQNNYNLKKTQGRSRTLFIGDSITARGKIIDQLRKIYGDEKFEYWNAGVESFNTIQEVSFYKKYNSIIKPDHVILTFSLNDFEATPVAFINKDNKIVVYVPNVPCRYISPFLFRIHLYRLILSLRYGNQINMRNRMIEDVKDKLEELKEILDRDNIRFTIIILPILTPYGKWSKDERDAKEKILNIVSSLNIEYVNLFEAIDKDVLNYISTNKIDPWHPDEYIAKSFAEYLAGRRLFNSFR